MADQDSAHISWLELFQPFTNARISQQYAWSRRELLNRMRGGGPVHCSQKLVKPSNV
ncbi:hypothetical protein UCMB321_0432 [Pseudomonas batumici]|uniref:Uncharacterized protein n=1 Tax=Pseudomonas batumici TaxID=226910 RepID=A0A0C2IGA6_9PSED|nr:hypothetical protein UCMB321_0432 [Pseudomonas batumici]